MPPSPCTHQAKTSTNPHNLLHPPPSPSPAVTPTTPSSPLGVSPSSTPSPASTHRPEAAPKTKEGKRAKKLGKRADNNNDDSTSSGSDIEVGGGPGGASSVAGMPGGFPASPATVQKYRDMIATSKGAILAGRKAKPDGTPNSARRKAMMNREKRFTFVLAVVIGVFVVCWFPFFFSYSLQAVCPEACALPEPVFTFFFWIGYCNSCLNPVIYTIFNKDFRRAFKKILCKNTKGTLF
ncbi:hypothetical protein AAFF_G00012420 [Aldrovandia affinis]|uniref:Alpha-2B adrenergic receptor n=1 Tax=Aldrovandia affinis TaxID=143900 RepID=A0AAD7S6M7_9TELE|nr:hypothetical protein AAFF_G00012420 [Aldrovandia affinis]